MTATQPPKALLPRSADPPPQNRWHPATWQDYVALRDAPMQERIKLAFHQGWLWIAMGSEGIWFTQQIAALPRQTS